MIVSSPNHWWQNWPKTHAYVAERMFFPKSAAEIADAVRAAEDARRPLRAVGGGWSFSDAALPDSVVTNRPKAYAVEAIAEAVAIAEMEGFVARNPAAPSIASIPTALPNRDTPGSMVMVATSKPPVVDTAWTYLGSGLWGFGNAAYNDDALLFRLAGTSRRPVRNPGAASIADADTAGSLMMFDANQTPARPLRDWFYHGQGVWSVGVLGDSVPPEWGTLEELGASNHLLPQGVNLSPRAANAAETLFLLLSRTPTSMEVPAPVYLINTRLLVSSLQQRLPSFLSDEAAIATSETPANRAPRRFLFHVEGGITGAELGPLLAHQSPPLTIQAISGSPGATLAGAISTATHGAEFNWPLLIDRVKAIHVIGPGGLQWWIEGSEPIADPQKLRTVYPDIPPERIIRGTARIDGILPDDWLKAAVVSMGSMGVIYSIVLEVVPLFGVHEVVVQKIWGTTAMSLGEERLFLGGRYAGQSLARLLRSPTTSADVSRRLVKLLQAGNLNGTGIAQADAVGNPINQYADLAFNPNVRPDGELDCWIGNREVTAEVPIDPQPPPGNETAEMLKGIGRAFDDPNLPAKLKGIYGFGSILDILRNFSATARTLDRLTQSNDFVAVALDTFLSPMLDHPDGPVVAQALLTGVLSGLLGTANTAKRSDKTGVSVGAQGFPDSGVMGTGLEVALSPADAFGFLQTEVLDKVVPPFMGYISIRLCSPTETLMGMEQYSDPANPCSVMIEVVGYGDDGSRRFIDDLQQRTVNRIYNGLDAMLHWGLENEKLRAQHLRNLKALQKPARSGVSKLNAFKMVRARVHAAAAPGTFRAFDNAFTERLELSTLGELIFCDAGGNAIQTWNAVPLQAPPGTPFVENARVFTEDLWLLNPLSFEVEVTAARIVCSGDTAGAPVFAVASALPFRIPAFQRVGLAVEFDDSQPGPLTGIVEVECGLEPPVSIPLSASVVASRHAELTFTPASFNFTNVPAGTLAEQDLTIANVGFFDAVLADANGSPLFEVTPAGPFSVHPIFPASSLPGGVAAGDQVKIRVVYQPESAGSAQSTLGIDMTSRTDSLAVTFRRHYDILITGTAQAPKLFLAPAPRRSVRQRELTTLDFGAAAPSTHAAASFWIRNVGGASLTVQGVAIANRSNFGIPDVTIFPATLGPGGEMEVPCDFLAPAIAGLPARGELAVLSDDPVRPGAVLTVVGRASGPHLVVPTELLDLGEVPPAPGFGSIRFRSDGTDPVTVRNVVLAVGTDFSVTGVPPLPAKLAPGTDLTLTVTLTSTVQGNHQDQLRVTHDGPSPNSQIVLRATLL